MTTTLLRHSHRDSLLIIMAAVHGTVLLVAPSAVVIAVAIWWTANTVAHNFIHLPFFRSRALNSLFSVYLSLLLGVPQTLWRDRHIAHHAGKAWRMNWSRQMTLEFAAVLSLWVFWASRGVEFFATVWLVGWGCGMVLCQLQGYFEHARGTVSHHGRVYNLLFFNDGYHVEHHARPGLHWSELPRHTQHGAPHSCVPAVLRWIELSPLELLERVVLASPLLQRFVVGAHARAFQELLRGGPAVRRATIVGGALFPRTVLVLQEVLPGAELTVVDRSGDNIHKAKNIVGDAARFVEASFSPAHCNGADLAIFPLAFEGDREALYLNPPAPTVVVHDWIWRRRGEGKVVSFLLLKRLNIIRR